ncbi:hypothetical protein [Marivita sp. XM-24bin2]|jgi:hypothetical protein|uniref:hypothetical protein n=1 Tax=unclassified Marivita TaxID=2632480 RepID=UPI0025BD305D|nr:hypothetical protein [Marivita sp. XM-24bin2]
MAPEPGYVGVKSNPAIVGEFGVTPLAQAAAIACITLGTGAAAVSVMNEDIPDMTVPELAWAPGNELDGASFFVQVVLDNGAEGETDTLVFKDGAFMSMDCQVYCDFGFSDYQTWTDGDVIHFTTVATCPSAPHRVVWHGQITDDEIKVQMSWTTRRWYWTHQITGTAQGSRLPTTEGSVSG